MNDRLVVKNMTFYAFHGDDKNEQELGQRYEVDVEIEIDAAIAATRDNLHDAVNYKSVFKVVEELVVKKRFNLIETLAVKISEEVVKQFKVPQAKVSVRKLKPPIHGILDYVEVLHVCRGD